MNRVWRSMSVLLLLAGFVAVTPSHSTQAASTVGDGTPGSCDDAALETALSGGGLVTFDCGPAQHTIELTSEKLIADDTLIDGGGLITLSGGNSTRLFRVGAFVTLQLRSLIVRDGLADSGNGSVISSSSQGRIIVIDSVLTNNHVSGTSDGGAISSRRGSVTIIGSTLSDNSAGGVGGAVYIDDSTLTVVRSTLTENQATYGGAIGVGGNGIAEIVFSTLSDNSTWNTSGNKRGGAIQNISGSVTIVDSRLTGNWARSAGGAIDNAATLTILASTLSVNGSAGAGGGALSNDTDGTAMIVASTLDRNSTTGDGGAFRNLGDLTVDRSTVAGNTAGSQGAALSNASGTTAFIASTITGNTATTSGGGIYSAAGATTIAASIIAENAASSGSNCLTAGGSITSQGSNLSDDAGCDLTSTGDIQNSASIDLDILTDNGGNTHTRLPLPGSDAIDSADCALTSDPDQRGIDRPDPPATTCDIGAVELGATTVVQLLAAYSTSGWTPEGGMAALEVLASGPTGATFVYDFDCDDNSSYETPGSGSGTLGTASCSFGDDGDFPVGVRVCDTTTCASGMATIDVRNIPPTIVQITTSRATQGQVTLTVTATDPGGANDPLTYSFDCDDDGSYEMPGAGNQGQCWLDPSVATATIGARVVDDELGIATASVVVGQSVTLCLNNWTGTVSVAPTTGCGTGTVAMTLPASYPVTFCNNPYNGQLTWSSHGSCAATYRRHIVPDDGPLHYCRSLWTGLLRAQPAAGQCTAYEVAGVIPA